MIVDVGFVSLGRKKLQHIRFVCEVKSHVYKATANESRIHVVVDKVEQSHSASTNKGREFLTGRSRCRDLAAKAVPGAR